MIGGDGRSREEQEQSPPMADLRPAHLATKPQVATRLPLAQEFWIKHAKHLEGCSNMDQVKGLFTWKFGSQGSQDPPNQANSPANKTQSCKGGGSYVTVYCRWVLSQKKHIYRITKIQ